MSKILATIVADSISEKGVRITTFELEYPRFIHSELMTHRMFSRNASSSRAIPISDMLSSVRHHTAEPIHWGKNQKGMQAVEELGPSEKAAVRYYWYNAKNKMCDIASDMWEEGAHKQIVNRILEPFQIIKVVVTATEFANFFHLRAHPDAQPEIQKLAELMLEAYSSSVPHKLNSGEWHMPYFSNGVWDKTSPEDLNTALILSASCCAQVSYRKSNTSLEKAKEIYERLVGTKPVHASPLEHQATPIIDEANIPPQTWGVLGITHMTSDLALWSGNFKGWIQHRQLISGHVFKEGETL